MSCLSKNGYLEEIEENGNKEKRVTEKGKAAGIEENERKSKYGGIYFAIVHTRLSQQMIIEMLNGIMDCIQIVLLSTFC